MNTLDLTFFALPKPFRGHVGVIQRNAVRSWAALTAGQVILGGDDEGIAEMAAEVGARHLPDIRRNEFGTPFLDDAFRQASAAATGRFLCYVNSDILFLDHPLAVLPRLPGGNFLLVGRRTDLDLTESLDFTSPAGWRDAVRTRAQREGRLQRTIYMDYFLFPRGGVEAELPAFLVGRPAWDGWMVYNALRRNRPVIDATRNLLVVHQNHDYGHVPQRRGGAWEGPEGDWNLAQLGEPALRGYHYSTWHATHATAGPWLFPKPRRWVRVLGRALKKRLGLSHVPLPA